jgi:hypothetical protein
LDIIRIVLPMLRAVAMLFPTPESEREQVQQVWKLYWIPQDPIEVHDA